MTFKHIKYIYHFMLNAKRVLIMWCVYITVGYSWQEGLFIYASAFFLIVPSTYIFFVNRKQKTDFSNWPLFGLELSE